MRFSNLKQDKGVAGLTILLSLIVMLFIIGLIVMIFALMSSSLATATYDTTTVSNEASFINSTTDTLANLGADGNPTVTLVTNTSDGVVIASGNYTVTAGVITNATATTWSAVNVTYTYEASNTGTDAINETSSAISSVSDWFSIFIVIGAMVVLILLTVIIITAIRGSGMIQGGSTSAGQQNVGYA